MSNQIADKPRIILKVTLLTITIIGLVVLAALKVYGDLDYWDLVTSLADPQSIGAMIVFVIAYTLLEPFFIIPGIAFVLFASVTWPPLVALGLSVLGSVGASVVGFLFARYFAKDYVQRVIPARYRKWEHKIVSRGFWAVVVVRSIFFVSVPAHWLMGVSKLGFWAHLFGTAVGVLPYVLVLLFFGSHVNDWFKSLGFEFKWVIFGFVVLVGALLLHRVARNRSRSTSPVFENDATDENELPRVEDHSSASIADERRIAK